MMRWLLLLVLSLCELVHAHGVIPQQTITTITITAPGYVRTGTDRGSLCSAYAGWIGTISSLGASVILQNQFSCQVKRSDNQLYTGSFTAVTAPGCAPDSALVGGECVCNAGFKPDTAGTACVAQNCQNTKDQARDKFFSWTGNGGSFCYQGCLMSPGVRGYNGTTNTSSTSGEFIVTTSEGCMGKNGGKGDGSDVGVNDGAQRCPTGQCPGTVNGASVCVPCKTTVPPVSDGASAPSGGTVPGLPGAPPGATSSETTTECDGGVCTTRTRWRNASGADLGSTEKKQSELGFCAANPDSPLCLKSSISGSCAAVSCSGDAIQCAIAKEQQKRACEFFAPTGAAVTLGAAQDGTARGTDHPALTKEVIAFGGLIDTSNRLAGGCPSDLAFSIAGKAITMPLSQLCSPLTMLGNVMVGLCMFAAVFIVFRN